jgi:hypothetical protein
VNLLPTVGALYLSKKKIDADFRMRRIELTRTYAENLLARRLEKYPGQWLLLSGYLKLLNGLVIESGNRKAGRIQDLYEFYEQINNWNSANALIFGTASVVASVNLRHGINRILLNIETEGRDGQQLAVEEIEQIKDLIRQLEITLRTDVGIIEVDEFEARRIAKSYAEIHEKHAAASGRQINVDGV